MDISHMLQKPILFSRGSFTWSSLRGRMDWSLQGQHIDISNVAQPSGLKAAWALGETQHQAKHGRSIFPSLLGEAAATGPQQQAQ